MKTTLLVDKSGRRTLAISTLVYESIRDFILSTLKETDEVTFTHLLEQAAQSKTLRLEGDLSWNFLTVKRDLELRGVIKVCIGSNRIQIISLNKKRRPYPMLTRYL